MGNPTRVIFEYGGRTYSMTEKQVEAAYRYQRHQYLLMDALDYIGDSIVDCEWTLGEGEFFKKYGLSIEEAQSAKMLERYVALYERAHSCDMPESATWESVIEQVLIDTKDGIYDDCTEG
jgi:hypothetical protein